MVKINEKKKAIELRENGYSLSQIATELKVSKSSASLWVRNIKLTNEQQNTINFRHSHPHTEITKKLLKEHGMRRGMSLKCIFAGQKTYTKIELKAKPVIETYFNTNNLQKEKIGNYWFDYCNNIYIIEYTLDNTKGINSAIKRFSSITNDIRNKYIICPSQYLGNKRLSLLKQYNVIQLDISLFESRKVVVNPT